MTRSSLEVIDPERCCPIIELRQYTLKPNARETLIELFEREFLETQEAVGMRIIGTFRDVEKADRFVWLRGFQGMECRATQLQQFYGGQVWKAHRDAANATMIDSDNVLLLRPAAGTAGFNLQGATRPPPGTKKPSPGLIVATIYHFERGTEEGFTEFFQQTIVPILMKCSLQVIGRFISAHCRNTFPALPVREKENVFVWFTAGNDRAAIEAMPLAEIQRAAANRIQGTPELLLLAPTTRSLLRA